MVDQGREHDFPPQVNDFSMRWGRKLEEEIEALEDAGRLDPSVALNAREAIQAWQSNLDHGAEHSYYVYEGMKWLAATEEKDQKPELHEAAAVLHDFAQFLKPQNPRTGQPIARVNQRIHHPFVMGYVVDRFGHGILRDDKEREDLVEAIMVHDDVFANVTHPGLSDVGQLLSDADKLFGASEARDPETLTREMISRNLTGNRSADGWYLLRDLTSAERDGWQYGFRWSSDALSAVRRQMHLPFYTRTAQELAEQMRELFPRVAEEQYGALFDVEKSNLEQWNRLNEGKQAYFVGKGQQDEPIDPSLPIEEAIRQAYERELPMPEQFTKNGPTKGWKLRLEVDGKSIIIDPSIARFSDRRTFIENVLQAFR